MIAKKKRVTKTLFSEVFTQGKTAGTPFFSVKFSPLKTPSPRFSFIVSKSVAKSAVKRNQLRRRGYAIVARQYNLFKVLSGVYLFFIKKEATMLPFAQFEKELLFVIKKLNHEQK